MKNLFLTISIFSFLIGKGLPALVHPFFSESPRLSDDSLVYLWQGKQVAQAFERKSQAFLDIKNQFDLSQHDKPTDDTRWTRARIAGRALVPWYPTYGILMSAIEKLNLGFAWSYALSELVVLLVLTFSIFCFGITYVGKTATSLTFLTLSFAIFPIQGLHYLIPSVLSMSLGLFFWSRILPKLSLRSPGVWLYLFIWTGIHFIAKAYLLIGLTTEAFSESAPWTKKLSRSLAFFVPAIFWILIFKFVPRFQIPNDSMLVGNASLSTAGVLGNLIAIWQVIKTSFTNIPGLWLMPLLAFSFKKLNRSHQILIALLAFVLSISIVYVVPRYPAEVFARIWCPFCIIVLLGANKVLEQFPISSKLPFRKIFIAANIGLAIYPVTNWLNYNTDNLNERRVLLSQKEISQQITNIKSSSVVLYLEADTTMMSSLLAGAKNLQTLVWPMLKGTSSEELIFAQRPSLIMAPMPEHLNFYYKHNYRRLSERKYAFNFGQLSDFSVTVGKGLGEIFLLFNNTSNAPTLVEFHSGSRSTSILNIKANSYARHRLDMSDSTSDLKIVNSSPNLWLEGIQTTSSSTTSWPWDEEITVSYIWREHPEQSQQVKWRTEEVFAPYATPLLKKYLDATKVMSDSGGIVVMEKTRP